MKEETSINSPKTVYTNTVLIILIVIVACILLVNYLLNTFLPREINTYAKYFAYHRLHKDINISSIDVDIIKGIELREVSLFNLEDKNPYLVIHRVHALPFYPSFLSRKKWFFSLTLEGVSFALIRDTEGKFNAPGVKAAFLKDADAFINIIAIKDCNLTFQDQRSGFFKEFKHLICTLNFSFPNAIHFHASVPQKMNVKGEYNFATQQVRVGASLTNTELSQFNPYINSLHLSKAYLDYASFTFSGRSLYQLKASLGIRNIVVEDKSSFSAKRIGIELLLPQLSKYSLQRCLSSQPMTASTSLSGEDQKGLATPLKAQIQIDECVFNGKSLINARQITTNLSSDDIHLANIASVFQNHTPLTQTFYDSLRIETYSQIKDFVLEKEGMTLSGNADINYQIPFHGEKNLLTCRLHEGSARNVPTLKALDDIQAVVQLQKDSLSISTFKTFYKGQSVSGKAAITNFSNPILYAEFQGNYPLQWFLKSASDLHQFKFAYDGQAQIELQGKLKGNISRRDIDYFVEFALSGLSIKDIKNIRAKGYLQKDKITINESTLKYKEIPLMISGTIENFANPFVRLSTQGPHFLIKTNAQYHDNKIDIKEMILHGDNSKVVSNGTVTLGKEPAFSLTGAGTLDFDDIFTWRRMVEIHRVLNDIRKVSTNLVPNFFSRLNKSNVTGALNVKFIVKGADLPDQWEIKLAGYSPMLTTYKLKASNIKIECYKNRDEFVISPLLCDVAGGKIDFRTRVDFIHHNAKLELIGNDIDLAQLQKQLELKNKKLAGTLSFEAFVKNYSLSSWDKLDGDGKIEIKDGNICELNLLKGMGEFLFIPDFDEIVFRQGRSDVYFRNNDIIIDNIELNSLQMDVKGGGKVSLGGQLHFLLFPEFNTKLIDSSDSLKKLTTGLLGKALIVDVQGTVSKPSYNVKPTILYPMNKIKSFFSDLMK